MKVRKLNSEGVNEFLRFLAENRNGTIQNIPIYLLDDPRFSSEIGSDISIEKRVFETRYDMGVYLVNIFGKENIQPYIGDQGFWSWFSLLWFEQLCPIVNGQRKMSKEYNYVLSKNYNHRPRHAIYMTWQLVNKYGSDAKFMLSKEPATRGEIIEQMMARQEILASEGVMRLASALYSDEDHGFKKGSASRKSAGCVSRYVNWLQQLQVTFDIFSTNYQQLESLLPAEFNRFRNTQ